VLDPADRQAHDVSTGGGTGEINHVVNIGSFRGRADGRRADRDFLGPLWRRRRVEFDTQLMQGPEDLRVAAQEAGY
jgi:hypothetical protein